MEGAATALMIFLQCSSNALDCRELQLPGAFQSIARCREALPAAVRRLSSSGDRVTGRCVLAADVIPEVDPIITGSAPHRSASGYAAVRVTRPGAGILETALFIVPRAIE